MVMIDQISAKQRLASLQYKRRGWRRWLGFLLPSRRIKEVRNEHKV